MALQARVDGRHHVSIGVRIYVESGRTEDTSSADLVQSDAGRCAATDALADTERRKPFLEIIDAASGSPVVTVIELLSPSNKRAGAGRDLYLRRRAEVLASSANLVEIDLLRGGEPPVAVPAHQQMTQYRVRVARSGHRDQRELYPITLDSRLPRIAIPLLADDRPIVLDLQRLLEEARDKSGLWRRIDYGTPPVPPLVPADADAAWARDVVAAR